MSKLPADFVKAPNLPPIPRVVRKKASLISPEPERDPHELVIHLTEAEYNELEAARQHLLRAGTEITLEQMIHRVFADWMMRARKPQPTPSESGTAPRHEHALARFRAFVASPLRSWRELVGHVWRSSSLS
jgi:hypothetical protein